jgi:hypothetical protein
MCPDTKYWDQMSYSQEAYREACLNEMNNNPEGVILHYGSDGATGRYFNGMVFVDECPCNGLTYFEDLIWADRHAIISYIRARDEQEQQWLKEKALIEKINESAKCQIEN